MVWTPITALYDGPPGSEPGGWSVLDPDNYTDLDAWDVLIDEMRVTTEVIAILMGRSIPGWTRGSGSPLRLLGSGVGENDYFYVSHISDFRDEINYMEADLYWTNTLWTNDPIEYKWRADDWLINPDATDDPRDLVFINEVRDGLDLVSSAVISAESDDGGV